ncbi:hypothetical protein VF21_03495 [Pseudogymnoascus sp. 05NY08]|nr:hypothetical protein VF21_03495 [Pseudogymnoascus sp. 05NY08]
MKLTNAFILLLLPLSALANPIPVPEVVKGEVVKGGYTPRDIIALRDEAAKEAGLVPRALRVCKIVNVVTTVSCRWNPWHAGWNGNGKSAVRTDFKPNTGHDFDCYAVGECIGGNWLKHMGLGPELELLCSRPPLDAVHGQMYPIALLQQDFGTKSQTSTPSGLGLDKGRTLKLY